jgi:alpha-beta hydrolase superfamily lysophospholipase
MAEALRDRWVVIRNSRGLRLAGELRLPAGPGPHPVVVFAHGRGSMVRHRNRVLVEALRARGLATLIFDFTGQGDSEGGAEDCTPRQQADDLESVVHFLQTSERVDGGPIGIVGATSSALAALTVAADDPEIRALVLKAGRVGGAGEVAARLAVPTLLVAGERDRRIVAENEWLLSHLTGPRCLVVIPGGDHLLEDAEALNLTSSCMAAWFAHHLLGHALHHGLAHTRRLPAPPAVMRVVATGSCGVDMFTERFARHVA